MKKVKIKGMWYEVIPHKTKVGSIFYNGTECDICFAIEGYYIEPQGNTIRIQETA